MVAALVGIRQAVSNKEYQEGQRLINGIAYTNPGEDNTFLNDIKADIFNKGEVPIYPMATGGEYISIVGTDKDKVKSMQDAMDPLLQQYTLATNKTLTWKEFETEEEVFKYVKSNEYQRDNKSEALLFAIGLPTDPVKDPNDYTIYMSENFPQHIPSTQDDKITNIPDVDNFNRYAYEGFMTLQSVIANYILQNSEGVNQDSSIDVFMSMGYIDKFASDEFLEGVVPTMALFILMIFIAPMFRLVSFLTQEKASKAREGMKIMGLNDAPYWISWFIYYFLI